jgi:hypothetical protein
MEEMCTRKATWASRLSGGKLPLHPSFFESHDQKKKRNMLPEDTLFTDSRVPRDFQCQLARNVCFHDDYLVALEDTADKYDYYAKSEASRLQWFEDQRVIFNQPGYFDGAEGVQRGVNPVRVRHLANAMETEDMKNARHMNSTPVIFYPTYPFNMAESMGENFMFAWAEFEQKYPAARKVPLTIAIPYDLSLPGHFRLLENAERKVEAFSAVSAECDDTAPLCFDEVVGCTSGITDENRVMPWKKPAQTGPEWSGAVGWEAFRTRVVHSRCPNWRNENRSDAAPVRVVFTKRTKNRRILNLNETLAACNGAVVAGRRLECTAVAFLDVLSDVCALQDVDVLVGTHGADLGNAMLMRRGTSLIELRAHEWWTDEVPGLPGKIDGWANFYVQKLWYTNSTYYWWYGADKEHSELNVPSHVARDKDIRVEWPQLSCTLAKAIATTSQADYEARAQFGNFKDCEDTTDSKVVDTNDGKAAGTKDAKPVDTDDATAADTKDAKAADTKDAKAADTKDAEAADTKDVKAADTKDANVSETEDAKAADTMDAKAADTKDTEGKQ